MESPWKYYEILDIDVWGNELDGYTINQAFSTGKYLVVNDDADEDNLTVAIANWLGWTNSSSLEATLADEWLLEIEDGNGKPIFQARRDEEKEREGLPNHQIELILV